MHASTPTIRPARPDDAVAIARVFTTAIEAKARSSYGPRERAAWIARGTASRFSARLADDQNQFLVAEGTDTIVGVGALTACELSLLYTAPQAPPGTGSQLLAAIEDLARRTGLAGLTLTASRNALAFYLRHDFTIVRMAVRPLPGGVALPVCLMLKTLGTSTPSVPLP